MRRIKIANLLLLLSLILIPNSIVWFNNKKNINYDEKLNSNLLITNYKIVSAINNDNDNNNNFNYARGSHFDAISRLSFLLNGLVDALIEKISFLAEIVIESSLEEQCEASCSNINEEKIFDNNEKKLFKEYKKPEQAEFNKNDIGNLKFFLDSFKTAAAAAADATATSGSSSDDKKNLNDSLNLKNNSNNKIKEEIDDKDAQCSIFNININRKDLPIDEMRFCCKDKKICYNLCGQDKKSCDLKFQSCLKKLCKDRFDYTNKTLIENYKKAVKKFMIANKIDINSDNISPISLASIMFDNPPDSITPLEIDLNSDIDDDNNNNDDDDDNNSNEKLDDEKDLYEGKKVNGFKRTTKTRFRDRYKACKLASKVLIIGNLAFGCQAYKQSQLLSCCKNNNNTKIPV